MEFGKHPGGFLDKEHSFFGVRWNNDRGLGIHQEIST